MRANQKYSDMHGFEYIEMTSLPREEDGEFWRSNPTWLKHKVVHDWIEEGFVETILAAGPECMLRRSAVHD